MTSLFKAIALFIAIACFVWVGVLWRWQSAQHQMSEQDIAIYLVALPLTLFALALLGRWAWTGAVAKAREREATAAAAPAPGAAPAIADDAERRTSIQLLTAQVNCPAGNSPAAVLAAAAAGEPRPDLDPELRDDDGLPVMSARIADLDVDGLDLADLEAAVAQRRPEWAGAELRPETRRALAALAPAVEAALAALQPWRARFGLEDRPAQTTSTSMLRVLAAWPADWTAFELALASDWLQAQVRQADLAAPARIAEALLPPGAGAQAWIEGEQLLRSIEREGRADVLLLTACHSAIGEASVQRLQAAQRLFTSRTPRHPIIGEAAAALLLAPPSWPRAPGADAEAPLPVRLHRSAVARRDKPVDEPGRGSNQAVDACIEQAQAGGPFAAAAIAAVVHDADQHTPRAAEAMTALLARLPHLQADTDVRQTGALNGQAGVAAPLLMAALAAEQARTLEQPCLALCLDDAQVRLALVARPAAFDPASSPAPAA